MKRTVEEAVEPYLTTQCILYSTTQFLLPACHQELHESTPRASSDCRHNYSENSTAVSSFVLSTSYCCAYRYGSIYWSTGVFLYESYVKYGSDKKCGRKFRREFPWNTVPSKNAPINLLRNSGPLGHLWPRNLYKTQCAYRSKTIRNRG
jgi:hypothetical protein